MRIGGLASGIDTEEIINKLMAAQRVPLDKMQQDRQKLTWQRDSFRDINLALKELKDLTKDMKYSEKYLTKKITSNQEQAVSATGVGTSADGTYQIQVNQLATNAINLSSEALSIDPDAELGASFAAGSPYSFSTYDENGNEQKHTFTVNETDSLKSVLDKITKNSKNNVRAFYDAGSKKVILETTRTGNYNASGAEITFDATSNSFFTDVLKLDANNEKGGLDAEFVYNNEVTLTSKSNSYELNGVKFQFLNKTTGNATLTVTNDTEKAFDSIMEFVNKYNELVDKLNKTQQEGKYRDFPPLTDAQKADMTEDQIKKWEEKAKSGLLRGDSIITGVLSSMRSALYSKVDNGNTFTNLTQIGLQTSANYMDGGKIVLKGNKPDALKKALEEDPESVWKLFSDTSKGESRGLINRLEDAIGSTEKKISERAGKDTGSTLESYTMGKQMKYLDTRISSFEVRLKQIETRYWNQFNAMEKAISKLNNQSSQLLAQFGGSQ